jgi:hypothetical protein
MTTLATQLSTEIFDISQLAELVVRWVIGTIVPGRSGKANGVVKGC